MKGFLHLVISVLVLLTTLVSNSLAGEVFSGVNAWFLYAQPKEMRLQVLQECKRAGFKTVRIFVRELKDENFVDYVWGVQNRRVSDVETVNGQYNDEVLLLIDQLMLEASQNGLKLIISLHDRWYLASTWEHGYHSLLTGFS